MRKEKFIYNVNSLSYEKIELTWKTILLRTGVFSVIVLACSFLLAYAWQSFGVSPEERRLGQHVQHLNLQYEELSKDIDMYAKVLANIKERDNDIYRMMFEMDPIDDYTWESGVGGSERYEKLKSLSNSDIMVSTTQKMDKLGRQINLQSLSLDTIANMVKEKEKMLAAIPSIRPVRNLTRNIKLFSGFGMRLHPIHKIRKMHWGIDFSAPKGTPIYATGDGKVIAVKSRKSGYGNHVIISHGFGYKSLYAHMYKVDVKVGQKVKKGEVIGSIGSTGTSTAPHLHYEVIQKGKKVNPIHFCVDGLTPAEYKEMSELAATENQSFDFGGEEFTD